MRWDDDDFGEARNRGSDLSFDSIRDILEKSGLVDQVNVKLGDGEIVFIITKDAKTLSRAFIEVGRSLTKKKTDLASNYAHGNLDSFKYQESVARLTSKENALLAVAERIAAESLEGRVFLKNENGKKVKIKFRPATVKAVIPGLVPG